jgi:hypothetical protein
MDIEVRLTEPGEAFAGGEHIVEAGVGDVLLHITDGDDHHTVLFEPEQARAAALALMNAGRAGLQAKYGTMGALIRAVTGKSTAEIEEVDPDHV